MKTRRILSLWFPRFGAERLMRRDPLLADLPLGVVEEQHNSQLLSSLNAAAAKAGLRVGQPVRDAHAMCEALVTRPRHRQAEARGELRMADPVLAADQFGELCKADVWPRLIFGVTKTVSEEEIIRVVDNAVQTFLARYGA